jgi:hypothetical protein
VVSQKSRTISTPMADRFDGLVSVIGIPASWDDFSQSSRKAALYYNSIPFFLLKRPPSHLQVHP